MDLFSNSKTIRERSPFKILYPDNFEDTISGLSDLKLTPDEQEDIINKPFKYQDLDLTAFFHHVRDSEQPLSPTDLSSIHEFIQTCQSDITHLTTSITETISTISQLCLILSRTTCQLIHRQDQLQLGQYLLSGPSNHLPDDILQHIFLLCFQGNENSKPNPLKAPLQLSSVCHRWRVVVNSTSGMWSTVLVDTQKINSIKLSKEWIGRCHFLALKLNYNNAHFIGKGKEKELGTQPNDKVETQSQFDELVELIQSSPVWFQRLNINFTQRDDSSRVLPLILKGHQEELEELIVRDDHRAPNLDHYPHLRRLYLYRPPDSWRHSPPPAGLTLLVLMRKIHWKMLEMILSQCPSLQSLYIRLSESGKTTALTIQSTVDGAQPETPVDAETISITHHNLTYLSISNGCKSQSLPANLLNQFDLPALYIFEYCLENHSQNGGGNVFGDFWGPGGRPLVHRGPYMPNFEMDRGSEVSDSEDYPRPTVPRSPPVIHMRTLITSVRVSTPTTSASVITPTPAPTSTSTAVTIPGTIKWLTTHSLLPQIRRLTLDLEISMNQTDLLTLLKSAGSVEELCIACDSNMVKKVVEVLTGIPGLSRTSGDSIPLLPALKKLRFPAGLSARDIRNLRDPIKTLLQAWSSPNPNPDPDRENTSGALEQNPTQFTTESSSQIHRLTHLDITYKRGDLHHLASFHKVVAEVNPNLTLRILKRQEDLETTVSDIPKSFEVYNLPFSDIRKYEVFVMVGGGGGGGDQKPEEGWEVKVGSVWSVESEVFMYER
ncbi:hypothetical protein BDN72DRAFT_845254 [Pluteus cervinus]|uniref:Uncharacterized protein n=1 Tax=Pluteus cervinus TaxID=181527 RepID=A0ACD3AJ06_9AGAR|nr:hypothetical protein BDN72DRAFT_845254 [Pluteus cervinus]